jgi:starch phosphorylase
VRAAGRDPDALERAHLEMKRELVRQVEARAGVTIDPARWLVGFARRAAGYKRSDLVLRDEARLERLLNQHGACLLFAGKAHPDDKAGKAIVATLVEAARKHPGGVVFLENYDMELGRLLTRGTDVWLNNPTRPLEASGTSGMKAALNGVLNVSILDGWWPEACEHGVNGWAIETQEPASDEADLAALYRILEEEVVPAWADRPRWRGMMMASIAMAEQKFTSDRMVREYFDCLYSAGAAVPDGAASPRRPERAPSPATR